MLSTSFLNLRLNDLGQAAVNYLNTEGDPTNAQRILGNYAVAMSNNRDLGSNVDVSLSTNFQLTARQDASTLSFAYELLKTNIARELVNKSLTMPEGIAQVLSEPIVHDGLNGQFIPNSKSLFWDDSIEKVLGKLEQSTDSEVAKFIMELKVEIDKIGKEKFTKGDAWKFASEFSRREKNADAIRVIEDRQPSLALDAFGKLLDRIENFIKLLTNSAESTHKRNMEIYSKLGQIS